MDAPRSVARHQGRTLGGRRGGGCRSPLAGSLPATLTADGPIFLGDGQPWRWKGVTAFKLLDRFAKGEDIEPFLLDFAGFNVLRIFSYTPAKDWGVEAWEPTDADVTQSFCAFVARYGFFVELTLLTDDDPARIDPAKRLIQGLESNGRPTNIVLEAGNEPTTHKRIDTAALRSTLEASGFLYSSGDYEDSSRWFGTYYTCHTARTRDWTRRAHDLFDFYTGAGPDKETVPHHVPCVADEPGKPQDVGTTPSEWRAYFGACALLGAGATFHCESGKLANRPMDYERALAAVALDAMNTFPADAPRGNYRRIKEDGQLDEARTYVVGDFMVRCQQRGTAAPEPGWTALDQDGILWKRG